MTSKKYMLNYLESETIKNEAEPKSQMSRKKTKFICYGYQ